MALEDTSHAEDYQDPYSWAHGHDIDEDDVPLDEDADPNFSPYKDLPWQDAVQELISSRTDGKWRLFDGEQKRAKDTKGFVKLKPSQFAELSFVFHNPKPTSEQDLYMPFSFEGRRHMRRIYDTPIRRILLCCGRQVEKSTLLGNRAITYSCLIPGFRTLYVSPSATQTKVFSNDRIKDPLETSPVLRSYTTGALAKNIFEKQFVNRSKITLRYSFLNADRTRGIPATALFIDELQDILYKNVPIMEQCTSHAPDEQKLFIYSGTPKTLDNTIEHYRSRFSTQGEWAVPCDCTLPSRTWNILGENNIGKKGVICARCGKSLNPQSEEAQWVYGVPFSEKVVFESYRISQLMVPWKKWDEILLDYARYPKAQFYNEVLGISYESGLRPITEAELYDCCVDKITMSDEYLRFMRKYAVDNEVFMGIDWGYGQGSFTIITLGTYIENKFTIFYAHRCTGEELEPPKQIELIKKMIRDYNVRLVGCDWGAGYVQNDSLIRAFGPERVHKFYWMAKSKKKVFVDMKLGIIKAHRTEVMSDIFSALKRKQIALPKWEAFKEPFAQDIMNIYAEYNERQRMIQYDHGPDRPDDTFHALTYCFLVSMMRYPRPDIIAPKREDPNQGELRGYGYSGPVAQLLQKASDALVHVRGRAVAGDGVCGVAPVLLVGEEEGHLP